MKLRYQGVLYEYNYTYYLSQIKAAPPLVLRYRGVFYSREIRSSDHSPEIKQSKPRSSGYFNYQLCRLGCQHRLWSHSTYKDVSLLAQTSVQSIHISRNYI